VIPVSRKTSMPEECPPPPCKEVWAPLCNRRLGWVGLFTLLYQFVPTSLSFLHSAPCPPLDVAPIIATWDKAIFLH